MNLFYNISALDRIWKGARLLNQAQAIYDALVREYTTIDSKAIITEMNKYNEKLSRSNQYKLVLNSPEFMKGFQQGNFFDVIDVFIKGVGVPSVTLSQKVVRLGTDRIATPGVIDTDTFTVTMYDTDNNFFHTFFLLWKMGREGRNGVIQFYPDDFKGVASIFRKPNSEKDGRMLEAYKMDDIYPLSVGDLRFDDDETNSNQVFDVTFYTRRLKLFDKNL